MQAASCRQVSTENGVRKPQAGFCCNESSRVPHAGEIHFPALQEMCIRDREQTVNPESNYSFGEGGAGAYSDGKLYKMCIRDRCTSYHIDTVTSQRTEQLTGNTRRMLHILTYNGYRSQILLSLYG